MLAISTLAQREGCRACHLLILVWIASNMMSKRADGSVLGP